MQPDHRTELQQLVQTVGCPLVAGMADVSPGRLYKFCQPLNASGELSFLDRMNTFVDRGAASSNELVRAFLRSLVARWARKFGDVVLPQEQLEPIVFACANGHGHHSNGNGRRQVPEQCPRCEDLVVLFRKENGVSAWCNQCRREVR